MVPATGICSVDALPCLGLRGNDALPDLTRLCCLWHTLAHDAFTGNGSQEINVLAYSTRSGIYANEESRLGWGAVRSVPKWNPEVSLLIEKINL